MCSQLSNAIFDDLKQLDSIEHSRIPQENEVDFAKDCKIYQYIFDIQMRSLLAKCLKMSKMQKMTYFYSFNIHC